MDIKMKFISTQYATHI